MEQHEQRQTRHQRKKFRKGRLIFLALLAILLAGAAYSIQQYRSGLKLASETKPPAQDFAADAKNGEIENFLILGVDSRGEEKSRTDTMMLLSWNRDTNDMKLVSFMRDIYADIPGYQSYKLNTAYYLGGVQLLKETLNTMFDVPIHHYAMIDFKSFEAMIDVLAPDGITVDVEKDMSAFIGVSLKQGTQQLNGKELLGYARFRQDAEGDFGRVARQQKVMDALKNELFSIGNAKNLPKFVGAAQGYITTDLTSAEELKMALSVATGGGVDIEKMTLPAEGTYTFNAYQHAGSVLEIDKEQNKALLHEFLQMK
ncbi:MULTISPECIES: LCP family protein [Bacillales]|uniref:Regulatory protein MsrR n=1 Tax=Lysinibacillus louembei TaxID=1470088 RepID=A0ABZ0RW01_9BACI|nr:MULTISPECIES: LCP family protein [Bacillales]MCT6925343.1 LCP family protein [Metasolibacillus sp.]MCT6941629.1 LCP family protein [Metasolibacillus sp.]WPK11138.1 LCP family protein [Lysinibacillus louembei]